MQLSARDRISDPSQKKEIISEISEVALASRKIDYDGWVKSQ